MKKENLLCWLRGVQTAIGALDNDVEIDTVQTILDDVREQINHVEPNTAFPRWLMKTHVVPETDALTYDVLVKYYEEWLADD